MNNKIKERLIDLVEDFTTNDGAYSDTALIEINPATGEVEITDEERDDNLDYYDIMDMVEMSSEEPGKWLPFIDAIDEIASNY